MPLRPALQYSLPSPHTVANLRQMVLLVEQATESADALPALKRLNAATGRELTLEDVLSYPSAYSLDTFVRLIAFAPPRRVANLQVAELVAIAQKIIDSAGGDDEAETAYYMALFDAQVTLPGASALIFHPPDDYDGPISDWQPSAEEVVELALRHRPIAL
jgi:hypothetical protein